jgi:hypothetical protein
MVWGPSVGHLQRNCVTALHFIPSVLAHVDRGYGATAARLTPDQKVGTLNLSALMFMPSRISSSFPFVQKAATFPQADS